MKILCGVNRKQLTKLYNLFQGTFIGLFNYKTYLLFLGASLAISIGLQMVLPFPYGLGAALAIFIVFPLFLRKRYMSRMRGYGGDSGTGGGFFGMGSQGGSGGVRYVCLVCNNKHKGGTCPRCGSKMQRADF
ncbi:hypothetical protein NZNM25_01250 [Nitrosopumilus zosterae]|uniref:Uncharacterized protein n=2 Tax=Nitrosopumilus TaxID=338191 RepID=A0A2S2KP23_9ARCH|nr:hypothetical protein NZNM25_01250 [Nitrosopumilus zosterae]